MSAHLVATAGRNRPPQITIAQSVERMIRVAAGLDRDGLPICADAGDVTALYRELDELCEAFRDVVRAKLADASASIPMRWIDDDMANDAMSDLFSDYVTGPLSTAIDELKQAAAEDDDRLCAAQVGVGRFWS